jgi:hypothetical protein
LVLFVVERRQMTAFAGPGQQPFAGTSPARGSGSGLRAPAPPNRVATAASAPPRIAWLAATDNVGMRTLLLLSLSMFCGCTHEPDAPAKAAPSSDLALPVTGPMQARERLLQDLRQQQNAANQRNQDFESTVGSDGR